MTPFYKDRLEILHSLSEDEFRKEALIPLLTCMGFTKVRERHGTREFGKDITFCQPGVLGDIYFAVVAKVGDISGSASGKGNLSEVTEQINEAFDIPLEDVETKQRITIGRVIVWTSGKISNKAESLIFNSLSDKYRNVDFKDEQATIALLEQYYPAFFTIRDPYISEYFANAKEHFSRIEELRTLGGSSDDHKLPAVFVAPVLMPFTKKKNLDSADIKVQFEALLNPTQDMLILGDGGSGKSTLLRRILISIIEQNENAQQKYPIPVIIEFKKIDLSNPQGLENSINGQLKRFCVKHVSDDISIDLSKGSFVVLIDGLDELQSSELISSALGAIRKFKVSYPKTKVIATSRLLDYFNNSDVLTGFYPLQISNLTTSQMAQFVKNWYGLNSEIGNKLMQFIDSPGSLAGLPRTPLTLALVAILYGSGNKEIPANLTELYDKYIELSLGRWDESRNIKLEFEWKVKQFILMSLAWEMQNKLTRSVTLDEFNSLINDVSRQRGLSVNTEFFIRELKERTEIMVSSEDEFFEFKHRSFQDYFVGLKLSASANSIDHIVAYFNDIWWSQSIFFACGQKPESDEYIKAILSRPVSVDKKLSYAIGLGTLTQAAYLAPVETKVTVSQMVLDVLVADWDDTARKYEFPDELKAQVFKKDILEAFDKLPMHLMMVGFYGVFSKYAIGSITLSSVLCDIADELLEMDTTHCSPRELAVREWKAYLLAVALSACNQFDKFIDIYNSGIFTDLSFDFWGQTEIHAIKKRNWLEMDVSKLDDLYKKLGARIKKNKKYLAQLRNPIPLPD